MWERLLKLVYVSGGALNSAQPTMPMWDMACQTSSTYVRYTSNSTYLTRATSKIIWHKRPNMANDWKTKVNKQFSTKFSKLIQTIKICKYQAENILLLISLTIVNTSNHLDNSTRTFHHFWYNPWRSLLHSVTYFQSSVTMKICQNKYTFLLYLIDLANLKH